MSTIHNPSQFKPEDYAVVDYFDNKPPEYHFGMTIEQFRLLREDFERDLLFLFPERQCHKCVHCGNGNIRYVVAVDHAPTGARVCFGCDCVARLGFTNQNDFKLAQIKSRAEAGHARMKIHALRTEFLATRPELAAVVEQRNVNRENFSLFVNDVLAKLDQYGSLSERQVECVFQSIKRDAEWATRRQAEKESPPVTAAPEGRVAVEGIVLSVKSQPNPFNYYGGETYKMLLKLSCGNKVWLSIPSSQNVNIKGASVKVTATFERSKDDQHFAFGKRPSKMEVIAA